MYQTVIKYPPKLKYARIQSMETDRVESTRRICSTRSHLTLRRENRREDEALGETTIESKSTVKKRTLGLELKSRQVSSIFSHLGIMFSS